jgi:hypothetical protein
MWNKGTQVLKVYDDMRFWHIFSKKVVIAIKAKHANNTWNKGTSFLKIFWWHAILADLLKTIWSCEKFFKTFVSPQSFAKIYVTQGKCVWKFEVVQKFGLFLPKFSQKQRKLGDFCENVCKNKISRNACPRIYRITLFIFWHRLTDLFMLFILWCVVKGGGRG